MDTLNVLKVDSRNSVNHKVSAIPRPIFSKSPIKDRRPFEKNFLCPIPEKSKPDSRNQGSRTENPEELNEVIQNLEKPTVVNVELPRNKILISTESQEIQGPEKSDLRNVQHNKIQKNKNIQWLDQLFPDQDKKINPEDIHEGNLTREQSEERLIWLLMTFAFITTIVLIYQIISLVGKLTGPAKVAIDYEPPTLNIFDRGFPIPHVAIINNLGKVVDFSLNESKSPSKGQLLSFKKNILYHGYSDPKGFLYFIHSGLMTAVIKYHSAIGESTLAKTGFQKFSLGGAGTHYSSSDQTGNVLWMMKKKSNNQNFWTYLGQKGKTILWFAKKRQFGDGFTIPLATEVKTDLCATSCNSSHIFAMELPSFTGKFMNIFTGQMMPLSTPPNYQECLEFPSDCNSCSLAVVIGKKTKKLVLYYNIFNPFTQPRNVIMSLDFTNGLKGEWTKHLDIAGNTIQNSQVGLKFLFIRGYLYSFMFNGTISIHKTLDSWEQITTMENEITSVIPYLA